MAKVTCAFPVTNENIFAVQKGLNPTIEDNIYSICGGGDVPFMFLNNGAKVFAVDYKPNQLQYTNKRIHDLIYSAENKNFKIFRSLNHTDYGRNAQLRDEYFAQISIDPILKNLENLTLKKGDFFELKLDFSVFNKVYTSNAPFYDGEDFKRMPDFVTQFKKGTLFYLTYFSNYRDKLDVLFKSRVAKENIALSRKLSKLDFRWEVSVFSNK